MNIFSFLNCLSINNVSTGSVVNGIYSMQSGSGDGNIFYNLLYPTGKMYDSGLIYTPLFPLINVGQPILNSTFSGNNCLRVGYSTSGDFGILLDISYNACQKNNLPDYCLLSSNTLNNSNKNFNLFINDANRLTFQTSGGYSYTLSQELTIHDFVYFSISQHKYITFGIFNVGDNYFYKKEINLLNDSINSDIIYIGSEFNNPSSTGFYGNINNIILFNQPQLNLNNCINCYFTTGFNLVNNITSVNIPQITGVYYSGFNTTIVSNIASSGTINKLNGNILNIEFANISSLSLLSGSGAMPLFFTTGINVNQPFYQFYRDTGIIKSFNLNNIIFFDPIVSGDSLEIYTYYYPVPNIGLQVIGFDTKNINGIMQLSSNGISETLNIDYSILRSKISGFYENDVLSYDILNSQSVVVCFSGSFNNIFTGINNGFSPILNVTGLSGISFNNINYPIFGYDLFLNGQKLISGYEYTVQNTGVSGFNVLISGMEIINPDLTAIDYAELSFIPQFNNPIYLLSGVIGTTSTLSGIYGFSEQIWVNGIRQVKNIDYSLTTPCSTESGILNMSFPFAFYNNDSIWNFNYPPNGAINYIGSLTTGIGLTGNFTWDQINNGTYTSGNYLEFWGNILNSGFNLISTLDTASTGYSWNIGPIISGIYGIKTRYRYNNIIGQFSSGFYLNY